MTDTLNEFIAARKVRRYPVLIRGFARSDLWRRNQDWRGVACNAQELQAASLQVSKSPRVGGHYELFQQN
jgi:hypothetical protein